MKIKIVQSVIYSCLAMLATYFVAYIFDDVSIGKILIFGASNVLLSIMSFGLSYQNIPTTVNLRITALLSLILAFICNVFFVRFNSSFDIFVIVNAAIVLMCAGVSYSLYTSAKE